MTNKKEPVSEVSHENRNRSVDTSSNEPISGIKFLIIIGAIILILIAIISVYLYIQAIPEPTIRDRYADVLNGIETNESYMYNGLVFLYNGFLWETVIKIEAAYLDVPIEASLATYYDPKNVKEIPVKGNLGYIDGVTTVYLTFAPNLDSTQVLAGVEVGKIVSKKFNLYNKEVIHAVSAPYEGNFPVITCANATADAMVIEFVISNHTRLVQESGCLSIQGETSEDLLRAADRYIFRLLRVMGE
jgi:hypothetical protein